MTKLTREELIVILKQAQAGDKMAEQNFILYIKQNVMPRRIGRFLSRIRQIENEDLKQEYMIGVALAIPKASMYIGDPVEFILSQGNYRVRSALRGNIIKNTVQICHECGAVHRLNRVGNDYICKKCGSSNVETQELTDNNEIALETAEDTAEPIEDEVASRLLIEKFEATLKDGTNVKNLYLLLKSGINADNPMIKNYIHEISVLWGGCSEQNVVQALNKLRDRMRKFADENGYEIVGNKFVEKE